jgi:hypothetical protein
MVEESRTSNGIERMADHLGVGEGQRYQRSRVMPVEGRALDHERRWMGGLIRG